MTKICTYFHYFTLFWGTIFWHSMTDNYFMIRYQVKNNIMYLFYYLTKAWVIKLIEFTAYLSWEWNCLSIKPSRFLWKPSSQFQYVQIRERKLRWRTAPLLEKCPNTELFLVRIFLYSVRIQENTDHKYLRIWTLFTQWICNDFSQ